MPKGIYIRTETTRSSLSNAITKWWANHPEEKNSGCRGGWNKGLTKETNPNLIPSEESKQKSRIAHLGNKSALGHTCSQEVKELLRQQKVGNKYALGHIVTEEASNLISIRTKEGMDNPDTRKRLSVLASTRPRTPESNLKRSIALRGEKGPAWKGGISFEPYGLDFNSELRKFIRKRDNYTCQLCGVPECECIETLSVHHIDYNKKNNLPGNLVALCRGCNSQVNSGRETWTEYFLNKIK